MKRLIIMVGFPNSGKTHYIKHNYPTALTLGFDIALNKSLNTKKEMYSYDGLQKRYMEMSTRDKARLSMLSRMDIRSAMLEGRQDVIVDETNLTLDRRSLWVDMATVHGYEVTMVHIKRDMRTCFKNQRVGKHIPAGVYLRMRKSFQAPTIEECTDLIIVD